MRRLLTTKKCCLQHEQSTRIARQPIQQPKIMVTSQWCTRNDSSNVRGILQPDKYSSGTSNRKLQGNKYEKPSNKTRGAHKKSYLGCNNCYCRYMTNKCKPPKRHRSPEKASKDKDLSRTCIGHILDHTRIATPPSITQSTSTNSHYFREVPSESANRSLSTMTAQYFLNEGYRESTGSGPLDFTEQRSQYEAFKERQDNYYDQIERYLNEQQEGENYKHRVPTITETKSTSSKESDFYSQGPRPTIEDLKQFRDEHYFETHNTDNLETDIPDHTCVHQYQLDDRLLPEPINADPYGVSRCKVCNQPNEADDDDSDESLRIRNFLKSYQLGRSPRKINVSGDKSVNELKVKNEEYQKFHCFIGRIRRPEYVNTYALRQQKMTV